MKSSVYPCKKGGPFRNSARTHISEYSLVKNQITANNSFRLKYD